MKFKSINTRLAILIAGLVFVSVAGLIVVVSSMTNSTVLEIQEQNMGVLNNKIVAEFEQFLSYSRGNLQEFAGNKDIQQAFTDEESVARAMRMLSNRMQNNKNLATLAAFDLNGKIIFGVQSNGASAKGADISSRDYVRKVLDGSPFAVSEVLKSVLDNRHIVVMAVPVRDAQGKMIGGFLSSVDWYKYSTAIIGEIAIGNDGYAYILDGKGRMIAHKVNQDIILKDFSNLGFVRDSLAIERGKTEYEWEGRDKIQLFQRVPSTGWVVCMSAYKDDLTRAAIEERNMLVALGVVMAVALVSVLVFVIRRQVTIPMANIRDFTSKIAHGNFKAELKGQYVCELRELADNVEHMVGEIKNKLGFSDGVLNGFVLPCSIVGPNDNMLWVNSHLCELIGTRVAPSQAVGMNPGEFFFNDRNKKTLSQKAIEGEHQIQQEVEYITFGGIRKDIMVSTTPFYDMDGVMLGSVSIWIDMTEIRDQQRQIEENNIMISEAAASATEVANQVSSFSEALAAQVEQSSRGAEEQSMMASEAATAMDEMNSTVFEVARNASTAADLAHQSQKKAGEGEKMVAKAVETISLIQAQSKQMQLDMAELGEQAEGIGKIMGVISDIADQTNLLALNAAIEAARAGDAGRGFAVVADEVRKLAESTMTATNEVGEYISIIQNSTKTNIANTEKSTQAIGDVTEMINQSGAVLKEIVNSISETSDQVRSIATASEQQSAASEEISRSTGQINAIASETSQAMNESAEAVGKMAELAQQLNRVIKRMQE